MSTTSDRDLTTEELQDILDSVGGEERYKLITNWCTQVMPTASIDKWNDLCDNGDPEEIKAELQKLNRKFLVAYEADPDLVEEMASYTIPYDPDID